MKKPTRVSLNGGGVLYLAQKHLKIIRTEKYKKFNPL